jgi:hypothetical protein
MLDRNRLDETWPGWLRAMSLLVRNYHGQSAQAAAASYRAAREQATLSPAPRSLIRLAPEPPQDWLDKAFGYSGPGLFQRDVGAAQYGPHDDAGHRLADRAGRRSDDDAGHDEGRPCCGRLVPRH